MKALLTRKVGMTSIVGDDGTSIAITLLSAKPNVVTRIKTNETDGYNSLQLGFESAKKIGKSKAGQFKNLKIQPKIIREFRTQEIDENTKVGDEVSADLFSVGDLVKVSGISKGKGFAGTIKRHNFHRGRKTHGGRSYRRPGSIGSMFPQRIFPGKKMAGQMGHERVSIKNLKIALVDSELQVIGVAGAVPGPKNGLVIINGSNK